LHCWNDESEHGAVNDPHDGVHYSLTGVHTAQRFTNPILYDEIAECQDDLDKEERNQQ